MKQGNITQLDLHDVPQVYHNLKYNDGEIHRSIITSSIMTVKYVLPTTSPQSLD